MDDKLNTTIVRLLVLAALSFYCFSLACVAFTRSDGGNAVMGYEALLLGWIQTYFSFSAFFWSLINFDLLFALYSLVFAAPWIANVLFCISGYTLLLGTARKVCFITSVGGIVCSSAFIVHPAVNIGGDFKLVSVDIGTGGYLWFGTSLTLLLTYIVKSIPNTPLKQNK